MSNQEIEGLRREHKEYLPLNLVPVIVLCGGTATRLVEITHDAIPKHLIRIRDKTILGHSLDPFKNIVPNIILCTGFLGEQIQNYFRDGSNFNFNIRYSHQPQPQGIIPAINRALQDYQINSTFIIHHGDEVSVNLNVEEMYQFHQQKMSSFTMAVTRLEAITKDYVFWLDTESKAEGFIRHPLPDQDLSGGFFGIGTFICEPEIIPLFKPEWSREELLKQVTERKLMFCFQTEAEFYNLNTLDAIEKFRKRLA